MSMRRRCGSGFLQSTEVADTAVRKLPAVSRRGALSLVRLVNRHNTQSSGFKDYEFSRTTITDLWDCGHDDACRMIVRPDARTVTEIGNGCRIYELTN
jgi:NTE family protein